MLGSAPAMTTTSCSVMLLPIPIVSFFMNMCYSLPCLPPPVDITLLLSPMLCACLTWKNLPPTACNGMLPVCVVNYLILLWRVCGLQGEATCLGTPCGIVCGDAHGCPSAGTRIRPFNPTVSRLPVPCAVCVGTMPTMRPLPAYQLYRMSLYTPCQ